MNSIFLCFIRYKMVMKRYFFYQTALRKLPQTIIIVKKLIYIDLILEKINSKILAQFLTIRYKNIFQNTNISTEKLSLINRQIWVCFKKIRINFQTKMQSHNNNKYNIFHLDIYLCAFFFHFSLFILLSTEPKVT